MKIKRERLTPKSGWELAQLIPENAREVYGKWGELDETPLWTPEHVQRMLYHLAMQQECGNLVFFTARDDEGKLIGYAVCFDLEHSHLCRHYLQVDSVYIHPEYRSLKLGVLNGLLSIMDDHVEFHDLAFTYFAMPAKVLPFMRRKGFEQVEVATIKRRK